MNSFIIEPTEFSPSIIFDPSISKFEISGESRPENTGKFYDGIIKWLEQYQSSIFSGQASLPNNEKINFDFKLEYFNSTSAKYILDVLKVLDNYFKEGYINRINWHYDAMDEDMKDSGEQFARLVKVPFAFVEK
jgi:hypothetical protein